MVSGQIEVHLYGRLRSLVGCEDVSGDCVQFLPVNEGTRIADVLSKLGVAMDDTSNIFLNGELSAPTRQVKPGDRLGVFPYDMATLYKWYFAKKE